MQLAAARTQPRGSAPEAARTLQEALQPAAGQTWRGDSVSETARVPLEGWTQAARRVPTGSAPAVAQHHQAGPWQVLPAAPERVSPAELRMLAEAARVHQEAWPASVGPRLQVQAASQQRAGLQLAGQGGRAGCRLPDLAGRQLPQREAWPGAVGTLPRVQAASRREARVPPAALGRRAVCRLPAAGARTAE